MHHTVPQDRARYWHVDLPPGKTGQGLIEGAAYLGLQAKNGMHRTTFGYDRIPAPFYVEFCHSVARE